MDLLTSSRLVALLLRCALVAGCAIGIGCSKTGHGDTCEHACGQLRTCGLLPSPLGAGGFDDCVKQCAYSDDEARAKIADCLQDIADSGAWCPTDHSTRPACEVASTCLREALGRAQLLGKAKLDLELTTDTALEDTDAATSACSDTSENVPAIPECSKLGISTVAFFVEQRGVRKINETMLCASSVVAKTTFRSIEPGPVLAGAMLKLTGQGEGTELCKVFLAGGSVSAGESAVRRIPIPSDARELRNWSGICETGALCTNGQDDDHDGQLDCADFDCTALELCTAGCVTTPCSGDGCATNSTCAARTPDVMDGGME